MNIPKMSVACILLLLAGAPLHGAGSSAALLGSGEVLAPSLVKGPVLVAGGDDPPVDASRHPGVDGFWVDMRHLGDDAGFNMWLAGAPGIEHERVQLVADMYGWFSGMRDDGSNEPLRYAWIGTCSLWVQPGEWYDVPECGTGPGYEIQYFDCDSISGECNEGADLYSVEWAYVTAYAAGPVDVIVEATQQPNYCYGWCGRYAGGASVGVADPLDVALWPVQVLLPALD